MIYLICWRDTHQISILGILTELVKKMEAGELSLEESVSAYEQGIKLKAYCEQLLKEAELKIETLQVPSVNQ